MAQPPARWALRLAALPLAAGIVLVLVAAAESGWTALGYAVLAVGCGGLALLLPVLALLAPGWDALTRVEAGIATAAAGLGAALLVLGLLAWIVELVDGGWLNETTALLLVADLAGLTLAGTALRRGVRRLRAA